MGKDFKGRLKKAVADVSTTLKLENVQTHRLHTPVRHSGSYEWISPMDSDGLLVATKKVSWGSKAEGGSEIRIGVIVQSEDTTALSKPNPFGKALVGKLPLGIWVDIKGDDRKRSRVRLDHAYVLFVLPTPAAREKAKIATTAARNVANALQAADDVHVLPVPKGLSKEKLACSLEKVARRWLVGPGRPRIPI